jgi:primosomal protein N' (replication factor Y)
MFAQVALPLPLSEPFTYFVPSHFDGKMNAGFRVLVPLRKKIVTGFVVDLTRTSSVSNTKEIIDLLDPYPLFSEEMLKLTQWVSEYYLCSWGEVLRAALPAEMMITSQLWIRKRGQGPEASNQGPGARGQETGSRVQGPVAREEIIPSVTGKELSPRQRKILELLEDGKERRLSWITRNLKAKGLYADIYDLSNQGIIEIIERLGKPGVGIKYKRVVRLKNFSYTPEDKELLRSEIEILKKKTSNQALCLELLLENQGELSADELVSQSSISPSALKTMEKKGLIEFIQVEDIREGDWGLDVPETQSFELNEGQKIILEKVKTALVSDSYSPFLIHGVTGSGKTQVYIEAIKEVLKQGKQALVLVPEISLTPQIISRFKANFGNRVGCLHSRLSAGERFDTWRRVRSGDLPIIVGARSAVFSPFQNLGLIVVDEEHDPSYKQDEPAPRYNARDVAVMRAKLNNTVVILGSATPSLESYYNAQTGKYALCQLPERVDDQKLPPVKIVDLTGERKKGNRNSLSSDLSTLLKERMEKGEQALLFLNRRGFSTFVKCQECGYIEKCPRCDITLTFHRTDFSLRCHYCNYYKKAPELCPSCQGSDFMYKGTGTQKIEEELKRDFPSALMERMDLDTTTRKGAHRRILNDFGNKKFHILLGTQMITKGLDFPFVTLVGVISADMSLDLPDFRSKERTFQLLTQVAGRAGRGRHEGEVIVQTFHPEEWSIQMAAEHDFVTFYDKEMEERRELGYPPFNHLILVIFSGKNQKEVTANAQQFSYLLRKKAASEKLRQMEILGPAPAPLSKIKDQHRWQLLIKTNGITKATSLMRRMLEQDKNSKTKKPVRIIVNVDPMDML